ncbi:class I SAM-dependent methyltransferase, partial [Escherichia coli]|nr:class I SAM-dependent methyltransferase [Escherichia coli]
MSDEATRRMPHSAEYFGAERDYFWNADYLDLLFGRLGLPQPAAILDVGCGEGHWARLIAGRLSPSSSVTGVDREAVHLAAFE